VFRARSPSIRLRVMVERKEARVRTHKIKRKFTAQLFSKKKKSGAAMEMQNWRKETTYLIKRNYRTKKSQKARLRERTLLTTNRIKKSKRKKMGRN